MKYVFSHNIMCITLTSVHISTSYHYCSQGIISSTLNIMSELIGPFQTAITVAIDGIRLRHSGTDSIISDLTLTLTPG